MNLHKTIFRLGQLELGRVIQKIGMGTASFAQLPVSASDECTREWRGCGRVTLRLGVVPGTKANAYAYGYSTGTATSSR